MGLMRTVERFIQDLSNWYVRRSRRRFWKSESDSDKNAAYATLYEVLVTLCKTLAPIIPFTTEEMYQNLVAGAVAAAPESVHLTDYPEVDAALIDERLESEVDAVIRVVEMGRAARNATQLKVRQPLARIVVKAPDRVARDGIEKSEAQIKEELNIKALELVDDAAALLTYTVKPDFKALGPKHGKEMGAVAKAVETLEPLEAKARVDAGEKLQVQVGDRSIELLPEEVEFRSEPAEGLYAHEDHDWVVALDVRLTDALVLEGIARDFIRHVASMRKEADFQVDDRINIYLDAEGKVLEAVKAHQDFISTENLARNIEFGYQEKEHNFNVKIAGTETRVSLEKV
jgi:isoleucyl-tRNA synthetase